MWWVLSTSAFNIIYIIVSLYGLILIKPVFNHQPTDFLLNHQLSPVGMKQLHCTIDSTSQTLDNLHIGKDNKCIRCHPPNLLKSMSQQWYLEHMHN